MSDALSFKNKVVLVTGSTRGVGLAIAKCFSRQGAQVVVASRRQEDVDKVCESIVGDGGKAFGVSFDVGVREEVSEKIGLIVREFGQLDVVINNAAIKPYEEFEYISEESWQQVMRTNLTGSFFVSQACLPTMKEQRSGSIINVASIAGFVPPDYYRGVHYITSKGGLMAMTKGLASEVGQYGIRVNAIAPGVIQTEDDRPEVALEFAKKTSIFKRPGQPHEVAETCLFLASSLSTYISGETIVLGGY